MKTIKQLVTITLMTFALLQLQAQNNVGIGTNTPDASAELDVKASDKGLLIPRVKLDDASTAAPITTPAEGLLIYNETGSEAHGFWYWDGAKWVQVGAGGGTSCVTLDEAYDCTTPGAGRVVTVNDGAIEYNQTGGTNTEVLKITTNQGSSGSPSAGIYVENTSAGGGAIYGEINNTSNKFSAIQGWSSSDQDNSSGISGGFDGAGAGYGIYGTNTSAAAGSQAIFGLNQRTTGGWGVEGAGINGVYGRTNDAGGYGIVGYNYSGYTADETGGIAVFGNGNIGVRGQSVSANGAGVYGSNSNADAPGVWGTNDIGDGFGTAGIANYGVFGQASANNGTGWATCAGIVGQIDQAAIGGSGMVGYLGAVVSGAEYAVVANGDLAASGTKSFMIDHPLDPENKILKHYCAESPEVLNIYRGNVTLDANGKATVQLPDYFEALNVNYSYQLTAIGSPATGIYIEKEISNNTFNIAGGNANQKISWSVYAERNDLYIQEHPKSKQVEIEKIEKGKYLRPELYGQSKDDMFYHMGDKKTKSVQNKKTPLTLKK